MCTSTSILGALTAVFVTTALAAQDHSHYADAHGGVDFPISCAAPVAPNFERAVATLHSFGYEEARRGFEDVTRRDPSCGIAHWGIAMSYFHPLWAPPTPQELEAGFRAATNALAAGGGTSRERDYIEAIHVFFAGSDRLAHGARASAYRDAMGQLADEYPEDQEASIFFALAVLGAASPGDATLAAQREAAMILAAKLQANPRHPGIAHYTIHAFDYPQLAELALPAARIYADIAPESPHAQHMPTHIFTRLGLWPETIASNIRCRDTAARQVAREGPGLTAYAAMHCQDYLAYAYLQLGEDTRARNVLDTVGAATRFDSPNSSVAHALLSVPARYTLERRDWAAAAALAIPDVSVSWDHMSEAQGVTHFANAVGAARSGEIEQAREAVQKLRSLHEGLAATPPAGPYDWAGKVESLWLAASGWLAFAEGRTVEAERLLRAAADEEDHVGKHPVTPGPVLPARELLGDLLMELGRPAEALAEYEASLATAPGRFQATLGAARAARGSADQDRAREHYLALLELAGGSEDRPLELVEARTYVGAR